MARNREKAQSMLYRFREIQLKEAGLPAPYEGRPRSTHGITNVRACERWRNDIVRELMSKITKIQDRIKILKGKTNDKTPTGI